MNRLGLDDAAVIEASRAEPDRFASLFDRHAPYIHRYLARRVGRQAADDLVAETFLVAFRKRARYDPRHHDARPWLYGIATNLTAQHRREEARQFRLRQAAGPDPVQHDHAERAALDVTAQSIRTLLATTPGLTVERHVRDVSGRAGIGVVWHFYGSKAMNIFDPRTFAYLGMTTWGEQGQPGGDALVQTAVVDRVGEMP